MRLFVAADLPEEVRAACGAWRDGVLAPALRPVDAPALHVTLSFLGERPEEDVGDVVERLAACVAPVPGVRVGAPRWLPAGRPRVLVLALEDPEGGLRALRFRVAGAMGDTDRRPFLPHVTVARVQGRVRRHLPPGPSLAPFDVPSLSLYRSHLGRGPASYEALWRATLARSL